MLKDQIINLKNEAIGQILEAKDDKTLEEVRIRFLGRSGKINELVKEIPKLPEEERVNVGKILNETKNTSFLAIENSKLHLFQDKNKSSSWFDITLPGEKPALGTQHPITAAIEEISRIFENIGFVRVRYPEITTDWYCFEGVNVPKDHPSRDDQETFFLENGLVLSTHTTSGILQEIERVKKPPIRMLNIARCYRRQVDVSHTPMFHQFEGWLIDKEVNVGHLKWTLDFFARQYFGPSRKTRLRPHHFQYTEPSFEVDINCGACGGKARLSSGQVCRFCKDGWVELGGSGMAHPKVLENAGLNPKTYSALAFGWGVERVMAMKIGVPDIRRLYQNDLNFMKNK